MNDSDRVVPAIRYFVLGNGEGIIESIICTSGSACITPAVVNYVCNYNDHLPFCGQSVSYQKRWIPF